MYVSDAPARVCDYVQRYGFHVIGAESRAGEYETVTLQNAQTALVLTQGHCADHPAAAFVERHGDGVADIALRVADAKASMRMALAAGARPARTGILAFGDVTHSFVDTTKPVPSFASGPTLLGLPRVDHVAVCLETGELDRTVEFYRRALGWRQIFSENIDVGAQAMQSKVVQSWSGGVTLTLLQPKADAEPGQINDFLANHGGSGVQHVALAVHDILRAVDELSSRGVKFLNTPGTYYSELARRISYPGHPISSLHQRAILADQDHDGQLFQIFTRSEHQRGTFFLEIIERQGARTFGSNNIRKLYEALEREQSLVGAPGPTA
jgi:4-hydroxymandelate synthase